MKLKDCIYGTLVYSNRLGKVGMITGLTENATKEAIPLVSWQDSESSPYHHAKLVPLDE